MTQNKGLKAAVVAKHLGIDARKVKATMNGLGRPCVVTQSKYVKVEDIDKLAKRLANNDAEVDKMVDELKALVSDVEPINHESEANTLKVQQLAKQLNESSKKADLLEREKSSLQNQLDSLQSKFAALQSKNGSLQSENAKLQGNNQSNASLQNQIASLQNQVASLQSSNESLQNQNSDLEQSNDKTTKNNTDLSNKIASLQQTYVSLQQAYASLQTENVSMKEAVEQSKSEIDSLSENLHKKLRKQTDIARTIFKQHTILSVLFLLITMVQISHLQSIYFEISPMDNGNLKDIVSWLFALVCESAVFYLSMYGGNRKASIVFTLFSLFVALFYFEPFIWEEVNGVAQFQWKHCGIGLLMSLLQASIIFIFGDKMHEISKEMQE